ncbi:MAG: hypothetical protein O8C66_04200 [Candidatus Methanoperedens sp.]|nr:hypothetical protein [Candidatus Methanoperedens sp.]MCZ7369689.1 hypothetical protein [Candidatus Methanoperedens sp.]
MDDLSPNKDKSAFRNLYLEAEKKRRDIIRNTTGHFLLMDSGRETKHNRRRILLQQGSRNIKLKMGKVYVDSVLVDAKNPVTSIILNQMSIIPFLRG